MNPLDQLAVSPSGFVFDPRTGATFSVNVTGRLLLEALREGRGLADLTALLAEQFDAGRADLHRDVLEFVHLLRSEGLLSNGFELAT